MRAAIRYLRDSATGGRTMERVTGLFAQKAGDLRVPFKPGILGSRSCGFVINQDQNAQGPPSFWYQNQGAAWSPSGRGLCQLGFLWRSFQGGHPGDTPEA